MITQGWLGQVLNRYMWKGRGGGINYKRQKRRLQEGNSFPWALENVQTRSRERKWEGNNR